VAESETAELLRNGLKKLGLTVRDELINAFMMFLSELKRWNRAYNLTGLKKDEDIVIKHFLDSLLYLRAIPDGEIKVADIGSGAGFPGIPIKIIRPEIEIYLIEPTKKKSAFLRHITRQLGLNKTEVIEKRIEEVRVNQELSYSVDVAISRALFNIKEFIKKASHILKPGGTLILNKGPKVKEELKTLGNMRYELLDVDLPLSQITRHIIVVTPDVRI
jgi:16S rRNA (guanine527-N7)-methyltransferase